MREFVMKMLSTIRDNASEVFDFLVAILGLISMAIAFTFALFAPAITYSMSDDWQWLLMYVPYALIAYFSYRVFLKN